mgnify:CR=1 FL=1
MSIRKGKDSTKLGLVTGGSAKRALARDGSCKRGRERSRLDIGSGVAKGKAQTASAIRGRVLADAKPRNVRDGSTRGLAKTSSRSDVVLERILFVPDCHRPYHDERAWQLVLAAARSFRPDHIVVLGDFGDFYSVSSHDKNPNRRNNLEYEITSIIDGLAELAAIGGELHFVSGNHEDRLERYLMQKSPELYNLVRIRELLRLDDTGWKYTPYRCHFKLGHLYVTHECGNAGPMASSKARDTFQGNVVIGHTHRMAMNYQGNARGEAHVGAMFGWLGDVEQIDYAHSVQSAQWQLGFGIGHKEPNGTVHLQAIPIVDYKCVLGGVLYRG